MKRIFITTLIIFISVVCQKDQSEQEFAYLNVENEIIDIGEVSIKNHHKRNYSSQNMSKEAIYQLGK